MCKKVSKTKSQRQKIGCLRSILIFTTTFRQQCLNVSLNVEYFLVSTLGEEERIEIEAKISQ